MAGERQSAEYCRREADDLQVNGGNMFKKVFDKRRLIDTQTLDDSLIASVEKRYDRSASIIFQLCLENKAYLEIVHADFPVYIAELIYFIRYQHVHYIDDMLTRRFSLRYVLAGIQSYKEIVASIISIMQNELRWSDTEAEQEKNLFIQMVENRLNIRHPSNVE